MSLFSIKNAVLDLVNISSRRPLVGLGENTVLFFPLTSLELKYNLNIIKRETQMYFFRHSASSNITRRVSELQLSTHF